jgi:hypothetical protein
VKHDRSLRIIVRVIERENESEKNVIDMFEMARARGKREAKM